MSKKKVITKRQRDKELLTALVALLSFHAGEGGRNEGAEDTLIRVIKDHEELEEVNQQKTIFRMGWKKGLQFGFIGFACALVAFLVFYAFYGKKLAQQVVVADISAASSDASSCQNVNNNVYLAPYGNLPSCGLETQAQYDAGEPCQEGNPLRIIYPDAQ